MRYPLYEQRAKTNQKDIFGREQRIVVQYMYSLAQEGLLELEYSDLSERLKTELNQDKRVVKLVI